LVQTLNTKTGSSEDTGMAFDASGNLYATCFEANTVVKFDSNGNLIGTFGSGYNADPESVVVNKSGNIYIGQADGTHHVLEFNSSGTLVNTFAPATQDRGTDWIDLAADQQTLHYTSEGNLVKSFNVATNTQNSDFGTLPTSPSYAHRILPDGQELVANTSTVVLLNANGSVNKTYSKLPSNEQLFALNLDPDGTSFWTADLGSTHTIYHVDIASGNILGSFAPTVNVDIAGLAVVGEITTGGPGPSPVPVPPSVLLFGSGLLSLAAFGGRKFFKRN
jgi:hypothetical protein